jgi:putative lipoic acid-binding regulatory protein
MNDPVSPEQLIDFPCDYTFKAMGVSGEDFSSAILSAVRQFALVSQDAVHIRPSGKGNYQSVSVLVWLENYQQLTDIYARMKTVTGLKMLL